uniref:WGS project CAEQ00000000 data, annotated contig 397 n=1 Tax=Trypanosoma congolense (strain IL3000) TaxID=1068625 RepID=F9WFL1_TRYCI|nr:unnamed protein product [Trypanosoma congolense IL3000]
MPGWIASQQAPSPGGNVNLYVTGGAPPRAPSAGAVKEYNSFGQMYDHCGPRRGSGTSFSVGSVAASTETLTVKHSIRFRGAGWRVVLSRMSVELERAIKEDVSACCGVDPEHITRLSMRLTNVLEVTFVVDHCRDPIREHRFHEQLKSYSFWRTLSLYPRK